MFHPFQDTVDREVINRMTAFPGITPSITGSPASQPFHYRREHTATSSAGTRDTGIAANNLSLVPGNQRSSSSSNVHVPNSNVWNRSSRAPPPHPNRPFDISGGEPDAWRLFEDRVRTGPYGLNRLPSNPFSPMTVTVLNGEMATGVNPMLRQFSQQFPPRIRNQWQTQTAPQDESRLTKEEQEKALKNLKKHIYFPKTRSRRWSVYYRDNVSSEKDEGTDEDGKRCAICLEDFLVREEVLVTPCNHMFHEECIIPWVKAKEQCPVCRFAIGL